MVQRRLDGANHVSNTCMCKEAERGQVRSIHGHPFHRWAACGAACVIYHCMANVCLTGSVISQDVSASALVTKYCSSIVPHRLCGGVHGCAYAGH